MLGKVITHLLKEHGDLTDLVPGARMFPYIVEEETQLPCLVYEITAIVPEYTKDGWVMDRCTFNVRNFSGKYENLQDIKLQVREALELKKGTFKGVTIQRIQVTGQTFEGYNFFENCYETGFTFSVNIIGWDFEEND